MRVRVQIRVVVQVQVQVQVWVTDSGTGRVTVEVEVWVRLGAIILTITPSCSLQSNTYGVLYIVTATPTPYGVQAVAYKLIKTGG